MYIPVRKFGRPLSDAFQMEVSPTFLTRVYVCIIMYVCVMREK